MKIEFVLPPAAEGVTGRRLTTRDGHRQIKMQASTTCSSLEVRAGSVVELFDDEVKVEDYIVTADCPRKVYIGRTPCQKPTTVVPPASPPGKPQEPSPVQVVQTPVPLAQNVSVQVIRANAAGQEPEPDVMSLTPAERFKRGYRPTDVDGKVVWVKD